MKKNNRHGALISISRKAFIEVTLLLLAVLGLSIALTWLIPRGEFQMLQDGGADYSVYLPREDLGGISILRGILAPILVFTSGDGLSLLMLSLFLCVISAAFQVMSDVGGLRSLVNAVSSRFRSRRILMLGMISFLFYCFGSFLGLFEEMLTMLPVVTALCVAVGFDSFTGFICCILACGFGFASAITNPFTVLLASELIGVGLTVNLWFRIVIFGIMFALLFAFLLLYLRRLKKNPASSLTAAHDEELRKTAAVSSDQVQNPAAERRMRRSYSLFLSGALVLILVSSLSSALRSYTVVILIVYFLFGGLLAGRSACGSFMPVWGSFLRGLKNALPTIFFVALAASIKYVFEQGSILPTVVHQINSLIAGHTPIRIALSVYGIVLLLEFFISSSTAKAVFIMGLLACVNTGLTKEMLVLLYTFGDGYTNVLFPTSPVLLISLSMIGVKYFTWLRKSAFLFTVNLLLILAFIILGVLCGY